MLTFVFMLFIMNNMQLLAMEPSDEGIVIEQEHKEEENGVKARYSRIVPESIFKLTLDRICAKKITTQDYSDWTSVLLYVLKGHPNLLESQKINGQFPLSFAFNRRDFGLTTLFSQAEHELFFEDTGSQIRLNTVLYEAVKAQELRMVQILLGHGASTILREGYDLLAQLVVNCSAEKLSRRGCCWKKHGINPQQEESAYTIAKLLIEHGARYGNAVIMARQLKCAGQACTYIRTLSESASSSFVPKDYSSL
jgi:hypothetical protein